MSDKFFIGLDVTAFQDDGKYKPVSRVTLLVDDENSYTAGDDTGMELSASCAHATQEMADSILASIKGHRYQAYDAGSANLDPAAELGDGVTVGGIYSAISRVSDDGSGYSDISAPGELELEDEYPSGGPMSQEFNRKIASTRSLITKTAEEILLQVEATDGRLSTLSVTVDGITSKVQGIEGNLSSIEQYVDSITLSVTNGSTSSSISLKAGGVEIASQTISMSGLVTFTGLSNGTTTIDGACIRTGTIDAERINLTGSIGFGELDASVRSDIDDAYSLAIDAINLADNVDSTVGAWTYSGTTYIDGRKLMTGTVMASELLGGSIGLLDSNERVIGSLDLAYTSTGYGLEISTYRGGIRINSDGNIWMESNSGGQTLGLSNSYGISCGADVIPRNSGYYDLGSSSYRWSAVYSDTGSILTSDRTKKHDINYGLKAYDAFFDLLAPASFRYNDGTSGRIHLGMISQDIEEALEAVGLTSQEFGGFIKSPKAGDEAGYDYALRYEEFIPLCIHRIKLLENRLKQLEG